MPLLGSARSSLHVRDNNAISVRTAEMNIALHLSVSQGIPILLEPAQQCHVPAAMAAGTPAVAPSSMRDSHHVLQSDQSLPHL